MQIEPFANIHHFEPGHNTGLVDVDGDPLSGYYFQLMKSDSEAITSLIGPYGSSGECEIAAQREFLAA